LQDTLNDDEQIGGEDEGASLRDEIEAAVVATADASDAADDDPAPISEGEGEGGEERKPARDAAGRFAQKQGEQANTEAIQNTPPEDSPAEKATNGAPSSWNAEARKLYAKADPALQAYIQQRESETQNGVAKLKSEFQGKANFAESVWKEIAPYQQMIEAEGGTPVAAIRDLLGMAATMRTGSPEQKRNLLLQTARQYGVDLGSAPDPENQPDPMIEALQREINGMKQQFRSREQVAQQERQATLQAEIDQFKADKPHFDRVRHVMGELIERGIATDLDSAYTKAVRLDDDLFTEMQADAKRRETAEQNANQRQVSERKKAAGSSVSGAPGLAGNGQTPQAPAPTLRAELTRAMGGRV
jgi:hypothetical protein